MAMPFAVVMAVLVVMMGVIVLMVVLMIDLVGVIIGVRVIVGVRGVMVGPGGMGVGMAVNERAVAVLVHVAAIGMDVAKGWHEWSGYRRTAPPPASVAATSRGERTDERRQPHM
jgi:hypothetical protein